MSIVLTPDRNVLIMPGLYLRYSTNAGSAANKYAIYVFWKEREGGIYLHDYLKGKTIWLPETVCWDATGKNCRYSDPNMVCIDKNCDIPDSSFLKIIDWNDNQCLVEYYTNPVGEIYKLNPNKKYPWEVSPQPQPTPTSIQLHISNTTIAPRQAVQFYATYGGKPVDSIKYVIEKDGNIIESQYIQYDNKATVVLKYPGDYKLTVTGFIKGGAVGSATTTIHVTQPTQPPAQQEGGKDIEKIGIGLGLMLVGIMILIKVFGR